MVGSSFPCGSLISANLCPSVVRFDRRVLIRTLRCSCPGKTASHWRVPVLFVEDARAGRNRAPGMSPSAPPHFRNEPYVACHVLFRAQPSPSSCGTKSRFTRKAS